MLLSLKVVIIVLLVHFSPTTLFHISDLPFEIPNLPHLFFVLYNLPLGKFETRKYVLELIIIAVVAFTTIAVIFAVSATVIAAMVVTVIAAVVVSRFYTLGYRHRGTRSCRYLVCGCRGYTPRQAFRGGAFACLYFR